MAAGEYRLGRWTPGSEMRLERFAEYWEPGRPYLDAIVFRIMADGDTRVSALRSGQVDFIMEVPSQDFSSLKGERGLRTHEALTLAWWHIYLNMARPPLDKRAAREALNLAIDRPTLLRSIIFGLGEITVTPFPSLYWAHNPALKPWPHDPARARAKLAEAGVPAGFTMDMVIEPTPEHVPPPGTNTLESSKMGCGTARGSWPCPGGGHSKASFNTTRRLKEHTLIRTEKCTPVIGSFANATDRGP